MWPSYGHQASFIMVAMMDAGSPDILSDNSKKKKENFSKLNS